MRLNTFVRNDALSDARQVDILQRLLLIARRMYLIALFAWDSQTQPTFAQLHDDPQLGVMEVCSMQPDDGWVPHLSKDINLQNGHV